MSQGSPVRTQNPRTVQQSVKRNQRHNSGSSDEDLRAKRIRLGLESPNRKLIYEVFDFTAIRMQELNPTNASSRAPGMLQLTQNNILTSRTHVDHFTIAFDDFKYNRHENHFHDEILGLGIIARLKLREFKKILIHFKKPNVKYVEITNATSSVNPNSVMAIGNTLRTTNELIVQIYDYQYKSQLYEITPRKQHITKNIAFADKLDAIDAHVKQVRQTRDAQETSTIQTEIKAKRTGPVTNDIIVMEQTSNAFLYMCTVTDYYMVEWMPTKIESMFIQYNDQDGIGPGVTRDFFQSVLNGIVESGIFRRISETSDRYTINHEYVAPTNISIEHIYWCAGRFIAFALANGMSFTGFRLGHIILDSLLYTRTLMPDEVILYYSLIDDDANALKQCTDMLRSGRDFNNWELTFEDEDAPFPKPGPSSHSPTSITVHKTGAVTHRNVLSFIRRRAFRTLFGPNSMQKHSLEMIRLCTIGFSTLYSSDLDTPWLPKAMTLMHLDDLLTVQSVTPAQIREHYESFKISLVVNSTITSIRNQLHARNLLTWFIQIVSSEDAWKEFPIELIENFTTLPSSKQRRTAYNKFIDGLIMFWTGVRFIMKEHTYQVSIAKDFRGLPKAHTCFFQIEIPLSIKNKDNLYKKLVQAVFFVEAGVGMYGGKRSKKIRRASAKK